MPIFYSILAALLPMSLYLLIIWRMDSFEREPLKLVLYHFLFGAVGAVVLSFFANKFLTDSLGSVIIDFRVVGLLSAVVIAPFVEELMKGSLLLFSINGENVDNLTDGLVYGGAIGLGFGMTENILYFETYGTTIETWISLVVIRSAFSGVMHCLSTGIFGAILASSKFYPNHKRLFYTFGAYLTSVLIHSSWNFGVSFEATYPYALLTLFAIVLFFVIVYRSSIKRERKLILENLIDETDYGLITLEQAQIISSPKRFKKGWADEKIRKRLIDLSIKLAFKKMQSNMVMEKDSDKFVDEISNLRNELKVLLTPADN